MNAGSLNRLTFAESMTLSLFSCLDFTSHLGYFLLGEQAFTMNIDFAPLALLAHCALLAQLTVTA